MIPNNVIALPCVDFLTNKMEWPYPALSGLAVDIIGARCQIVLADWLSLTAIKGTNEPVRSLSKRLNVNLSYEK